MNNLPCEVCTKTDNHCCLADIPYDYIEALKLCDLGRQNGLDLIMVSHPKFEDKVIILNSGDDGILENKPCVFLKNGKCSIYEDRPFICRNYGTDFIRCRYEACGISDEQTIRNMTKNDIKMLDKKAGELSDIVNIQNQIKVFRSS